MTAERATAPERTAPWVRGYTLAVYADLDGGLDGVARLRGRMGPGWDPIPSYEFHLALAKARLAALGPAYPGGDAAPPTQHSGVPTGLFNRSES